ncbi:MAG: pilus assembly protein PilM [Phycisphaerae bacterium]|nr:pilus assembly protein PilM [Phycisphaerae bacterium]
MVRLRMRNTAPIAIDVGATSVRALQVQGHDGAFSVRHWSSQSIDRPKDDKQGDGEAEALSLLEGTTLSDKALFAGRQVVTSLGPPEVEVCLLQVPEKLLGQDRETLVHGVRQEVGRNVRIPIGPAEVAAWPLPRGHMDGPNVLAAAVSREVIEKLLKWLDGQGWVCTRLDLAPLAAMRACSRITPGLSPEAVWGVLDIGFRSSRLYLGIGETPMYIRTLRASGDLMTRRIASELGIELSMAERYKRHYGVRAEPGSYRPMVTQSGPVDDVRMAGILLGVLTPIFRGMVQDIEKSFRYAMDLYPSLPVHGLVLAGGGGTLDGLDELLTKMLGIPVHRLSSERLPIADRTHPLLEARTLSGMVTCLGLSYGEL